MSGYLCPGIGNGVRRMSVGDVHKTVLLLFVAVLAESLVAEVLRTGSIRAAWTVTDRG
jgi:hypothetical protein